MRNRSLLAAFALALVTTPAATAGSQVSPRATAFPPPAPESLVVGALSLKCRPNTEGVVVNCIINLAAVLVGAHTLTPTLPNYDFDVAAGNATAKGTLSVNFLPPDQLSTLQANLVVTSAGQQPQPYRGAFMYWNTSSGASIKSITRRPDLTPTLSPVERAVATRIPSARPTTKPAVSRKTPPPVSTPRGRTSKVRNASYSGATSR